MSKHREFWIAELPGKSFAVSTVAPRPPSVRIHVREVVPSSTEVKPKIDWDKIWEKYWEKFEGQNHKIGDDYIQQLVEKQLRGEE